ncbi:MAG TPA: plastocyanin/azurin family copper-binding protein [Gemmatimonadaceae bacterium]|jgi:plastocyanin
MRVRLLALAAVVAACGSDNGPTKPSTNKTVEVVTFESTFSSNFITINAGDTVRWTFSVASDGFGHNVLFNPRPPGTPPDIAAEKKSGSDFRVFSTPGTFHYVCTLHGSMTGDVVVQ